MHTFAMEYIHISLFYKYKFIFGFIIFSLDLSFVFDIGKINMTLWGVCGGCGFDEDSHR
jgi:hypothetical protein